MFSALASVAICIVIAMSAVDGLGSPEGWLWTKRLIEGNHFIYNRLSPDREYIESGS